MYDIFGKKIVSTVVSNDFAIEIAICALGLLSPFSISAKYGLEILAISANFVWVIPLLMRNSRTELLNFYHLHLYAISY
nr:MAG TPA: hypothetical protein [Caudoviricetes sp.]